MKKRAVKTSNIVKAMVESKGWAWFEWCSSGSRGGAVVGDSSVGDVEVVFWCMVVAWNGASFLYGNRKSFRL